jgi:membrane-anchored protein YejM (alkaline phosphatase superfamily)
MEINNWQQSPDSVLFITLDSCRYDTFESTYAPNLKALGMLYRAMSPGNFTYGAHAAMFMGFTPGVASRAEPFINPKFGKIFKLSGAGFPGKGNEHITLEGRNIIDGFKRRGYYTLGTGAVGWFDPNSKTGKVLTEDFDEFYFPGNGFSLQLQLQWLTDRLADKTDPTFTFLNIGETHVPYYYSGAPWDLSYNPCEPFGNNNDADVCRLRQSACLEYVDRLLLPLLDIYRDSTVIVCADHGDCWGEDGLWEHGIYHEKVHEVPLVYRLRGHDI